MMTMRNVDRRDVKHWTDGKAGRGAGLPGEHFRLSGELVRLCPRLQAVDGEQPDIAGRSIVDLTVMRLTRVPSQDHPLGIDWRRFRLNLRVSSRRLLFPPVRPGERLPIRP